MNKKYEYDVQYEVWMMGGNPDAVDSECVEGYYEEDFYPEEAAQREINIQRKSKERVEEIE